MLCIFLGGIIGCSTAPEEPDNLIPEKKYVNLLVELQLVRSYGENTRVDSTTIDSLTSEVYEKYEISSEQFRKSHQFYQHFPKKQKNRVDRAIEKLKMELVTEPADTTSKIDTLRRDENLSRYP